MHEIVWLFLHSKFFTFYVSLFKGLLECLPEPTWKPFQPAL